MLFHMKDQKAAVLENDLNKLQKDGPAVWASLPEDELFTPAGFSEEQAEATAYSNYSYWGSSIYIESLYSIPGMGGLLVTCVQRHDNTMVQGIVLLYACVGIIGLILGDLLMVLIDPRINFGKKEGGR